MKFVGVNKKISVKWETLTLVDEIYLIISARKPRACQIVMVRPRSKNFEFSNKTYVPRCVEK
ncbi:MAG: hypothetical protein ACP5LE_05430 [Thermoplasmata archaeon]